MMANFGLAPITGKGSDKGDRAQKEEGDGKEDKANTSKAKAK
jgi:hypothetical protein